MKTIYVSQGHSEGVGLEVYFQSLRLLTTDEKKHFHLFIHPKTFEKRLKNWKMSASSLENLGNVSFLSCSEDQASFESIKTCCDMANSGDVVFNLPTEKKIFPKSLAGHTEYYRDRYQTQNLGMFFHADDCHLLLLTDHVSIKQLPIILNEKFISEKISFCLPPILSNFPYITDVELMGLNPHGGENGQIGSEDKYVRDAVRNLKIQFPRLTFMGPTSGDTALMNIKKNKLFISLFHDQGLAPFKALYRWTGSHMTLGLPFMRWSLDHGTGLDIVDQGKVSMSGCLYVMKDILHYINRGKVG